MRQKKSVVLFVIGSLFSSLGAPMYSQGVSRPEDKQTVLTAPAIEELPYAFAVADRIHIAVSNGCPVVVGVAESVNDEKIDLTIEDVVSGSATENRTISLSLEQFRKAGVRRFVFSPWREVKIEVGKQLLLAKCDLYSESRSPEVVVSDESLFVPIRNAIAKEKLIRQDPTILLQISSSLAEEKGLFYAGYVFSLLWGSVGNKDVEAIAQSEILRDGGMFPESGLGRLRIKLRFLMELESEPLTGPTRKTVLANLIAGAINKKGATSEIFTLLCRFVDKDEINIASLVTSENRDAFVRSYRWFRKDGSAECGGQRKFENQLNLK